MTGRLRTLIVVASLVVALVLAVGEPVSASCVTPPPVSAYAFTGTVVSTAADGRIAQVVTDDGTFVEVRGTPDPSVITSVDRTYRVGGRYEFHPLNAASPYEDNICTATHELAPDTAGSPVGELLSALLALAIGVARSG